MYSNFAKLLVFTALSMLTIIFSIHPLSAPFKNDLTFEKVIASLGGIFIIVLLVERVTEIVITVWREPETEELKAENEATNSSDMKKKLAKYQAETKSIALIIGFAISVIVCCAGIGLLNGLVDNKEKNDNFLRGIDIVLTSGLIAGGSDSFHQFIRALEVFFNKLKELMEAEDGKKKISENKS